jgi:hypothetical protein
MIVGENLYNYIKERINKSGTHGKIVIGRREEKQKVKPQENFKRLKIK